MLAIKDGKLVYKTCNLHFLQDKFQRHFYVFPFVIFSVKPSKPILYIINNNIY